MRRRLTPQDREREIIRAARRAFASQPYEDVHVEAIARDAGASRALVNHYFGDKRGLFLAVARDIVERTPRAVRVDLGLGTEEMVAANTRAWLDLLEASRGTALMFMGTNPFGLDPEFEALRDELRDRLADRMLRNHLGDGGEIPPAAHRTMRAATGLMEQAARDWLLGKTSREETEAIVTASILAVVRHVIPAVLAG